MRQGIAFTCLSGINFVEFAGLTLSFDNIESNLS